MSWQSSPVRTLIELRWPLQGVELHLLNCYGLNLIDFLFRAFCLHLNDPERSSTLSRGVQPHPPVFNWGYAFNNIKVEVILLIFFKKTTAYLCKLWSCVIKAIHTTVQKTKGTQTLLITTCTSEAWLFSYTETFQHKQWHANQGCSYTFGITLACE